MKSLFVILAIVFSYNPCFSQSGTDTLHYKKVYYFAGTGIGIPLGKTKNVLSSKLFAGSMGLDIALKNPRYYVYPALYLMSFNYDQLINDSDYNRIVENGRSNFYMLSLAGGTRRQYDLLNTYAYLGPTIGLVNEPRANDVGNKVVMESKYSMTFGTKLGVGADYKFKGFFLGAEIGYLYNVNKIQGNPVHVLTVMVGLKSDITRLGEKVVDILLPSK
ncbi:hypothetical protein [Sphingobacterium lumbrici]|uniref:hypothetical protein n=1 Tax=Sphingobacterium lumbrici TaxID=2559600 RepID=UPI001126B048|nr:hypothetical protein [Sphingobacterium lumbrici]